MAAAGVVNLYDDEMEELLNSPEGPVGVVIGELSDKAAAIARARAPAMGRLHWSLLRQYGPPGATRESVRSSGFRFNGAGQLYSGVNVNYGPTLYLQKPARQYRGSTRWMFMTQALEGVEL